MTQAELDRTVDLDSSWRAWIAENLAHRVPKDVLVDRLVRRGLPEERANKYVAEEESACHGPAGAEVRLLRTLAAAYNDNCGPGVDYVEGSEVGSEFFAAYYGANRPVVLRRFAHESPVRNWSFETLSSEYGQHMVTVQANRRLGSTDAFRRGRQVRVRLGEYLAKLQVAEGNATYLTGNDRALSEPGLQGLRGDLRFHSSILDRSTTASSANLWISGTGATSPLHCDRVNVLNVQVLGRKRFLLSHPGALPDVYAVRGLFSVVDALRPDLARFPDFARVRLMEVVLEPSDALFIPVGWWHHVSALEASVNLSFTNFAAPNTYDAPSAGQT